MKIGPMSEPGSVEFSPTGTHDSSAVTLEGIDRWLSLVSQKTERFDFRRVGYDEAAEYTQARDESWFADASTPDGSAACLRLGGKASVDLYLAVFENDGDGVVQQWESVPAFKDEVPVNL